MAGQPVLVFAEELVQTEERKITAVLTPETIEAEEARLEALQTIYEDPQLAAINETAVADMPVEPTAEIEPVQSAGYPAMVEAEVPPVPVPLLPAVETPVIEEPVNDDAETVEFGDVLHVEIADELEPDTVFVSAEAKPDPDAAAKAAKDKLVEAGLKEEQAKKVADALKEVLGAEKLAELAKMSPGAILSTYLAVKLNALEKGKTLSDEEKKEIVAMFEALNLKGWDKLKVLLVGDGKGFKGILNEGVTGTNMATWMAAYAGVLDELGVSFYAVVSGGKFMLNVYTVVNTVTVKVGDSTLTLRFVVPIHIAAGGFAGYTVGQNSYVDLGKLQASATAILRKIVEFRKDLAKLAADNKTTVDKILDKMIADLEKDKSNPKLLEFLKTWRALLVAPTIDADSFFTIFNRMLVDLSAHELGHALMDPIETKNPRILEKGLGEVVQYLLQLYLNPDNFVDLVTFFLVQAKTSTDPQYQKSSAFLLRMIADMAGIPIKGKTLDEIAEALQKELAGMDAEKRKALAKKAWDQFAKLAKDELGFTLPEMPKELLELTIDGKKLVDPKAIQAVVDGLLGKKPEAPKDDKPAPVKPTKAEEALIDAGLKGGERGFYGTVTADDKAKMKIGDEKVVAVTEKMVADQKDAIKKAILAADKAADADKIYDLILSLAKAGAIELVLVKKTERGFAVQIRYKIPVSADAPPPGAEFFVSAELEDPSLASLDAVDTSLFSVADVTSVSVDERIYLSEEGAVLAFDGPSFFDYEPLAVTAEVQPLTLEAPSLVWIDSPTETSAGPAFVDAAMEVTSPATEPPQPVDPPPPPPDPVLPPTDPSSLPGDASADTTEQKDGDETKEVSEELSQPDWGAGLGMI